MTGIPPSLPFHVAKAYGVRGPQATPPTPAALNTPVVGAITPESGVATVRGIDSVSDGVKALVAGVTTVQAEPEATPVASSAPSPIRGASLPFYRNPADQNAVATTIDVGRSLDVEG